jgi:hypothetical protein
MEILLLVFYSFEGTFYVWASINKSMKIISDYFITEYVGYFEHVCNYKMSIR